MSSQKPIEIFGHRGVGCSTVGGESLVPENSFAAFELAAKLGIDGVELDVWLTKDEQVVVLHGGGCDLDGYLFDTVVDIDFNRDAYKRETENNIASSELSSDVVFTTENSTRLRRIEEIKYRELQQAGQLKLRQPWPLFRSQSVSNVNSLKSNGKLVSDVAVLPREVSGKYFCTDCLSASSATNDDIIKLNVHCFTRSNHENNTACKISTSDIVRQFLKLPVTQQNDVSLDYREHLEAYVDGDTVLEVPLLKDVFERFQGRLRFNVELKGTNPKLGEKVLELSREYPAIIARVSSFIWGLDNRLCGYKPKCTKRKAEDLLLPLINKELDLALLIGGYFMPSVKAIAAEAKKYGASWVHVSQSFSLQDIEDRKHSETIRRDFLSQPSVPYLLKKVPLVEKNNSETPSDDSSSTATTVIDNRQKLKRKEVSPDCRDTLLTECLHMFWFTRQMHRYNIKVLVYGSGANEHESIMQLNLLCGIDGLCSNDVNTALRLTSLSPSNSFTVRRSKSQ